MALFHVRLALSTSLCLLLLQHVLSTRYRLWFDSETDRESHAHIAKLIDEIMDPFGLVSDRERCALVDADAPASTA